MDGQFPEFYTLAQLKHQNIITDQNCKIDAPNFADKYEKKYTDSSNSLSSPQKDEDHSHNPKDLVNQLYSSILQCKINAMNMCFDV